MPKTHRVPRLWPGETVVCIASGPSLTPADVDYVRGRGRVIVINATYALAPWADVLYCADENPFKWYWKRGPQGYEQCRLSDFSGHKFSLTKLAARWPDVKVLGRGPYEGISLDPGKVCIGANSGHQAINVAALMGAARILLLGYDMQVTGKKRHWHADHPVRGSSVFKTNRSLFATAVEPLKAAGIEIVNCSRETALECFPRMTIEEALPVMDRSEVA